MKLIFTIEDGEEKEQEDDETIKLNKRYYQCLCVIRDSIIRFNMKKSGLSEKEVMDEVLFLARFALGDD